MICHKAIQFSKCTPTEVNDFLKYCNAFTYVLHIFFVIEIYWFLDFLVEIYLQTTSERMAVVMLDQSASLTQLIMTHFWTTQTCVLMWVAIVLSGPTLSSRITPNVSRSAQFYLKPENWNLGFHRSLFLALYLHPPSHHNIYEQSLWHSLFITLQNFCKV